MAPKKTVKARTSAATQKVYHWTLRRLSNYHWAIVLGSASPNTCFRMPSRSCQKTEFSICLCSVVRWLDAETMWSRPNLLCWTLNQRQDFLSCCGNRRASVRIVSSINPAGNIWHFLFWWYFRKVAWWKMAIRESSYISFKWSEMLHRSRAFWKPNTNSWTKACSSLGPFFLTSIWLAGVKTLQYLR